MPSFGKDIVKAILSDLARDSRVDLHQFPLRIGVASGTLTLQGVVGTIAAKRIAHHTAHRHAGSLAVLDLTRVVAPAAERDGKLGKEVLALLEGETVFNACGLAIRHGDRLEIFRPVSGAGGGYRIEIEVREGVVTLLGEVLSLTHRRMAEVLAWWAAGCEAVDNRLHVVPPEQETDGELADAVRLILEKDPLVNAAQLSMTVKDGTVVLQGRLASGEERLLAEQDVWYVPGVRDVVNEILVGG